MKYIFTKYSEISTVVDFVPRLMSHVLIPYNELVKFLPTTNPVRGINTDRKHLSSVPIHPVKKYIEHGSPGRTRLSVYGKSKRPHDDTCGFEYRTTQSTTSQTLCIESRIPLNHRVPDHKSKIIPYHRPIFDGVFNGRLPSGNEVLGFPPEVTSSRYFGTVPQVCHRIGGTCGVYGNLDNLVYKVHRLVEHISDLYNVSREDRTRGEFWLSKTPVNDGLIVSLLLTQCRF